MTTVKEKGVDFDYPEQLEAIRPILIRGERLILVYDCRGREGGYVALTDRRLIFQDMSFIPGVPMLTSVPIGAITTVELQDPARICGTCRLSVTCGCQTYRFRFYSREKANKLRELILKRTVEKEALAESARGKKCATSVRGRRPPARQTRL